MTTVLSMLTTARNRKELPKNRNRTTRQPTRPNERVDNRPIERRRRSDRPGSSRKHGRDGSGDDEGERQRFAASNLERRVQRTMPLYMSRSYPTARQVLRKREGHWWRGTRSTSRADPARRVPFLPWKRKHLHSPGSSRAKLEMLGNRGRRPLRTMPTGSNPRGYWQD